MKKILLTFFSVICLSMGYADDFNSSHFGVWKSDRSGLPFFNLDFHQGDAPWYPFYHFHGTGYNTVLTNRWGDVNLITSEYGISNLTPVCLYARGGFYPILKIGSEQYSLAMSDLNKNTSIHYGIGYSEYSGEFQRDGIHVAVTYKIMTPFDFSRGYYVSMSIKNLSSKRLEGTLSANADYWRRPTYKDRKEWMNLIEGSKKQTSKGLVALNNIDEHFDNTYLMGDETYDGKLVESRLILEKQVTLSNQESENAVFKFGYNDDLTLARQSLSSFSEDAFAKTWKEEMKGIDSLGAFGWEHRESVWCYSQLLSMCFFDKSIDEYYIHVGGYALADNPSDPYDFGFNMREVTESAMILASFNPRLAKSSLRWAARCQLKSGDMLRGYNNKGMVIEDAAQRLGRDFPDESDTEIWFLMACGEYYDITKDIDFFSERVPYRTKNETGTIWEHMVSTFDFIKNDIGVGPGGLIRMLHGDWNDYLSRIGEKGKGESMMNTGMMCKALIGMNEIAKKIDPKKCAEITQFLKLLQTNASRYFDQQWFVRSLDDEGRPIGGYSDRLFINAQSWAALGKCGTEQQRRTALLKAVELCSTPIGMALISKPYSNPTPINISKATINPGEGENAGIWPQTVAWMIWALADEGLVDVAKDEWIKSTLANHNRLYPYVPLGIFNGPDCFSSHFAKEGEGWTQVQMFNRMMPVPMSPMIAWQPFGLLQIKNNSAAMKK